MAKCRSPFGNLLRQYRQRLGLSQAGLARRIAAIAEERHPAGDGFISEKTISNLEAEREPGDHVTPRGSTVMVLARALGLARATPEFDEFLAAARPLRDERIVDEGEFKPRLSDAFPHRLITAGREAEISRLSLHLEKALRGEPQVVFLAGDSGIGKTFLIRHACEEAVGSHPSLVVTLGEANSPSGLGDPYHPFKEALALLTSDTAGARRDQLLSADHAARLRRLTVPSAEILMTHGPMLLGPFVDAAALYRRARRLAPRSAWWLSALDRISSDGALRGPISPDQLHEQYVRVLVEVAKYHPLVLVLDDLHWADDRTCDLLFFLARRLHGLRNTPLLVIGAYRLADLAAPTPNSRHPLQRVLNEVQRYWGSPPIDLTSTVGNENGRAFIDGLLDAEPNDFDAAFRSLLFSRTEGHPLFVTELLQWMRDHQVIVRSEKGRWVVRLDVGSDELPPRVSAVVAERLARLPAELRTTLSAASVQGLSFAPEVVANVLGIPRQRLAIQMEELVARHRILIPESPLTSAVDTHHYRFTHSLFQEYLEGSLSPFTRQTLHLDTAEAIIHVHPAPSDASLDIARHFEMAEDLRGAAEWYLEAGRRRAHEFAYETAQRWFGHALNLARDLEEHKLVCRASLGMSEALRAGGDHYAAIRVGLDALEAGDLSATPSLRAESLTNLGVLFYDIGNNDQAESYLTEALTLLDHSTDAAGDTRCIAHYVLSYTYYARGAYSQGVEHAYAALAAARDSSLMREKSECLIAIAYYHVELGDYAAALEYYELALKCQRDARDMRGEAVSLLNIGLCRIELWQLERAAEPLEEARQFGERMQLPRTQAIALTYFGLLQEAQGEWSRAAARFAAAYQLRLTAGQEPLAIDALAGMVRAAVATGDLALARKGSDEILEWLASRGTDGIEFPVRVYLTLVDALTALGDPVQADNALMEGYALLSQRAASITDPDLRRSFLERVPFNRALVSLYSQRVTAQTSAE